MASKWIDRFMAGCELVDRSRRPHTSPRAVAVALEDVVEARRCGCIGAPRRLRAALALANPGIVSPSMSTFAVISRAMG